MNTEQEEKYKKAFQLFDRNGDGKISMDELETVMKSVGNEPTKLELNLIMKDADTDRNGVITLDEFMAYMSRPPKGRCTEAELKAQFHLFDKDNDGYITIKEMYSLVRELKIDEEFPEDLILQMFIEADENKDGKISYQEYIHAMRG